MFVSYKNLVQDNTVNPAIFHRRHETFTPPFHHVFLSLRLQILNSITHFQVSKWNKQYKWYKNSLDQKIVDFRGCECRNVICFVWKMAGIDGIKRGKWCLPKKHCGKLKNTTISTLKYNVYCQKQQILPKTAFYFCWISNFSEKNFRFRQYLPERAIIVVSTLKSWLINCILWLKALMVIF